MKKLMNEYELQDKQAYDDDDCRALEEEIRELKAQLARVLPEQYKEWNGLVPGSPEAVAEGCKCPVMDNAEMPDDRKWVNADCPLHGKAE
jgi:hypothetical protein